MPDTLGYVAFGGQPSPEPSIAQQELWLRQSMYQADLDRQAWMMREQKEKERRDREFQWQMQRAQQDAQRSGYRQQTIDSLERMREEYGLKEQDRIRKLRNERMQQGWQLPEHLQELDKKLDSTEATALEMFQRGNLDKQMLNQVLEKVDEGRARLIPTVRPQGQMGMGGGQFMTDPNGGGTVFQYNDGNQIRAVEMNGQRQQSSHDHQLAIEAMRQASEQTVMEHDPKTGRPRPRSLTPEEIQEAATRNYQMLKKMVPGGTQGGMQGGMPGGMPGGMQGGMPGGMPGGMQGRTQGGMPVSVDDGIRIMGGISPSWANAMGQLRGEPEAALMSQVLATKGRVPSQGEPEFGPFVAAMNTLKQKVAMSQFGRDMARTSQFEADPEAPPEPEARGQVVPQQGMQQAATQQGMQQAAPQQVSQQRSASSEQAVVMGMGDAARAMDAIRRIDPEIATAMSETAGDPAAKDATMRALAVIRATGGKVPSPGTPERAEFAAAMRVILNSRNALNKGRASGSGSGERTPTPGGVNDVGGGIPIPY